MAKTVAEILSDAADLVEPEGCWTQGVVARTADGKSVNERSQTATCWCVFGAIRRVGGFEKSADLAIRNLRSVIPIEFIGRWHDAPERTQAEVVAALRLAAEKANSDAMLSSRSSRDGGEGHE